MKTNLLLTSDSERKREGAEMGGGGKRAGGKSSHLDACLRGCHHCFSLKHNIPCVAYNIVLQSILLRQTLYIVVVQRPGLFFFIV